MKSPTPILTQIVLLEKQKIKKWENEKMSKEKSTIRQSDLVEMLDRQKSFVYDLQDFAMRNQAEVTLRIMPDGNINFQVVEKTSDYIYWKSLDQKDNNYKYQEARNSR